MPFILQPYAKTITAQLVPRLLFLYFFRALPHLSLSYCRHLHCQYRMAITIKRNERKKGGAGNSEEALGRRPINGVATITGWWLHCFLTDKYNKAQVGYVLLHGWGAVWLYNGSRRGYRVVLFYPCAQLPLSLDLIVHRIAKKTEVILLWRGRWWWQSVFPHLTLSSSVMPLRSLLFFSLNMF